MAEGGGFFIDQDTDPEPHHIEATRSTKGSSQGLKAPHVDQRNSGTLQSRQGQGPTRSGCTHCVSLSYSEDFYKAFGVYICGACKKDVKMISKTTAKQQYLLTDGDLRSLGSLERKNPRKKDWNPMRLYMESQVQDLAYAKYGGQAGLEWEARVKVSKKLESRIQEKEKQAFESARKSKRIKQIHDALKQEDVEQCDTLAQGLEEDI